eukprot:COSAG06_NODE_70183_length_193_cov_53.606383_1_plen_52_part_01
MKRVEEVDRTSLRIGRGTLGTIFRAQRLFCILVSNQQAATAGAGTNASQQQQ